MVSTDLPDIKTLVSSAKSNRNIFSEIFDKSFTYNRKSRGPKIEP